LTGWLLTGLQLDYTAASMIGPAHGNNPTTTTTATDFFSRFGMLREKFQSADDVTAH